MPKILYNSQPELSVAKPHVLYRADSKYGCDCDGDGAPICSPLFVDLGTTEIPDPKDMPSSKFEVDYWQVKLHLPSYERCGMVPSTLQNLSPECIDRFMSSCVLVGF